MSTAIYDVWYYVNGQDTEQILTLTFAGGAQPDIETIEGAVAMHLKLNTAGYVDLVIKDYRHRITV